MRHLLTGILLFLLSSPVIAQLEQIDSLTRQLEATPDSSTVLDLNDLLFRYAQGHKDTTLFYAWKMLYSSEQIDYAKGIALAFNNMGLAHELNGDLDSGIFYYEKAVAIADPLTYSRGTVSRIYNNLSIAHSFKGEMEKSIEYLLKVISISESTQDSALLATAYNNLGLRYMEMNSPGIALDYLQKAATLNETRGDTSKLAINWQNIGNANALQGQSQLARKYLYASIKVFKSTNQKYHRLISYQLLANHYYIIEELDSATIINDLALALSNEIDDQVSISDSKRLQAMLLMKQGKYDEAIPLLEAARKISEDIGYQNQMSETYKYLGRAYAAVGDYKNAQNYYALTLTHVDSVIVKKSDEARMKLAEYQEERNQQLLEVAQKDVEIERLRANRSETINVAAAIGGVLLLIVLAGVLNRYRFIRSTNKVIAAEKQRSDDLLLNILPEEVATELKEKGEAKARLYNHVTILFTDFKNFTEYSAALSPSEVVEEIDTCYRAFDNIISKYEIEKIKTIGDAYMAAAGLPSSNPDHALEMARAAIEIRDFMTNYISNKTKVGKPFFEIRIGLHSGSVVAGIVGIKKFAYDIWGDTVNIAARMESNSEPGKINISESTFELIKDDFDIIPRGEISVKGKGMMKMYFVN